MSIPPLILMAIDGTSDFNQVLREEVFQPRVSCTDQVMIVTL